MNSINAALAQANLLFGVEMDPDDFEEAALIAWNKIGNKNYRLYRFRAKIDPITLSIDLPCNCDEIEAVTYDWEDWNYTTNVHVNGDYNSQFIENYIEGRKLFNNPFYMSGKYAKYQKAGDTLYFEADYGYVNILYKGVLVDDDGLPEVNDKEVEAIAYFIAFIQRRKEGWQTHNQEMLQEAQLIQQEWLKLCDAARIPTSLSQNEMNEILDAKTRWDRKLFGKSYKFTK